jgi:enoyl-CoA hydratase
MNTGPNNPLAVPCVQLEIEGVIARITFNNPSARNALTWPMYEQFRVICDQLTKMPEIRVAILRGAGNQAFVSGSDIQQFLELQENAAYEEAIDPIFSAFQRLPFPTIALIEGVAAGSGLLITTACDFRISTPDARFGIPVAKTLGNCLSASNLAWLSAHLGIPLIKRMLLTAEFIKAPELLTSAYLYQIVSAEEITQAGDALAAKIGALAPLTQKSTKIILAQLIESNLPDCTALMRETYNSSDFKEGVRAFLEGRPPQWQGK